MQAFEQLYHHFERALFLYAKRMLSFEDAQEAVQISFIKLFKSIGQFRFQSKFSTYLFKILIRSCYDISQRKTAKSLDFEHQQLIDKTSSAHELKFQLEDAILKLPERMRQCFVLFAVEGFKQDEIGTMLSVSTGTVKAHIFNAKQRLRKLLT